MTSRVSCVISSYWKDFEQDLNNSVDDEVMLMKGKNEKKFSNLLMFYLTEIDN